MGGGEPVGDADGGARGDAVLDAAAIAAERFLRGGSWRAGLDEVLARLGTALDASRAYLYRTTAASDEAGPAVYARWSAAGAPPAPADATATGAAIAALPWRTLLAGGQPLHGLSAEQGPELRSLLVRWSVRSFAVVPIEVAGGVWGVLGVSDCARDRRLSAVELNGLATTARVLGAALERERAESALRASEERLRLLVHNVPAVVYLREAASGKLHFLSPAVAELAASRR
jgi:GAF domain-containing protein